MKDAALAYPGKYLEVADLQGKQVTATIEKVEHVAVRRVQGGSEPKWIVTFQKKKKVLLANKTNLLSIAALIGRDMDKWAGKRITLKPSSDLLKGETVACIRIAGSPDAPPERVAAFQKAIVSNRTARCWMLKQVLNRFEPMHEDSPTSPQMPEAREEEDGTEVLAAPKAYSFEDDEN